MTIFKFFVVFMMLPLNIAIISPLAVPSGDARAHYEIHFKLHFLVFVLKIKLRTTAFQWFY